MISRIRTNSSVDVISFKNRLKYLAKLTGMNWRRPPPNCDAVLAELTLIAEKFEFYSGKVASNSRVLEIGFGARPFRAFALQALFGEVVAVDLDQPVFRARDIGGVFIKNGLLRAVKAAVRSIVFDRGVWVTFHNGLRRAFPAYDPQKSQLIVADAGDDSFWRSIDNPFDLIVSFDVFEHIPPIQLQNMLTNIRRNLTGRGLVMTYPNLFTGITGGHDPDWYAHRVEKNSSNGAWNHILDPNFQVDTYLNKMGRRDMASMFTSSGFQILVDRPVFGRLGEQHLTPSLRQRLSHEFDDYELFSNQVEFILCDSDAQRE